MTPRYSKVAVVKDLDHAFFGWVVYVWEPPFNRRWPETWCYTKWGAERVAQRLRSAEAIKG